jgi:hypothetical protein
MRIERRTVLLIGAALTVAACQKNQPEQNATITNNVPDNADVETLPPDESSETPSNELANGVDNSDVTDLNAANSVY